MLWSKRGRFQSRRGFARGGKDEGLLLNVLYHFPLFSLPRFALHLSFFFPLSRLVSTRAQVKAIVTDEIVGESAPFSHFSSLFSLPFLLTTPSPLQFSTCTLKFTSFLDFLLFTSLRPFLLHQVARSFLFLPFTFTDFSTQVQQHDAKPYPIQYL